MSDVHITLTGDEEKAVKAFLNLVKAENKLEKKTTDVTKATDKLGKAYDHSLRRQAVRAIRETETAIERVKRETVALRTLLSKGLIDESVYRRKRKAIYDTYKATKQVNSEVFKSKGLFTSAFGSTSLDMLRSMTAGLGLAGGLAGGLRLVISYYNELAAAQKAAFDQSRNLASVEELTTLNLASVAPSKQKSTLNTIKNIANDLDVPEESVHRRFRDAISRKQAGTTPEQVLSAVKGSYGFVRHDDETGSSAAGFAARMSGRGWTAPQSLGLLEKTGALANVSDMRLLTKWAAPALTRGLQAGLSEQEVGALFASRSTKSNHVTGDRTKTPIDKLFNALQTYKKGDGKAIPGKTGEDRMRWLVAHPEESKQFVQKASLGESRTTFRDFFSGGKSYTGFEQYAKEIPGKTAAGEFFEQSAKTRYNTPRQRIARTGGFVDRRLASVRDAIPEQIQKLSKHKEAFDEFAIQAGMWLPDRKYHRVKAFLSGDDAGDWKENYEVVEQNLANRAFGFGARKRANGTWAPGSGTTASTAIERQQAQGQLAEISPIVDALGKLQATMDQTNRLLEKQEGTGQKQLQQLQQNKPLPGTNHNDHE